MTTAPASDARDHMTALKDALRGELGRHVYDHRELQGEAPPENYVLVSVERRFVPVMRVAALPSRSSWRVSLRFVGTTEGNARLVELRATEALEGRHLEVAGHTSTPIQHESSTAPEYDEGRMSGLASFTYTC